MKKFITLFIVACVSSIQAQITITDANIINDGVNIIQWNDTMPSSSITPGGTGSQTWSFTNLAHHTTTQFAVELPSATPYASYYPAATHCATVSTNNYYYYFHKNVNELSVAGNSVLYNGNMIHIVFNPLMKLITFPSTYQTTFNDISKSTVKIPYVAAMPSPPFPTGTNSDSARMESSYARSSDIDAYGTITIPMGTYPCLRQKTVEIKKDSAYVHVPVYGWFFANTTAADTTIKYTWWTNDANVKYPLVEMTVDANDVPLLITYLVSNPIAETQENQIRKMTLYPNPASDFVTISNISNGNDINQIKIFSINGKQLHSETISISQNRIDVRALPSGVYFIELITNNSIINQKLIIQR